MTRTTMNYESMPSIRLDILTYREEGCWVGHCVQLDLVVSSKESAAEAYEAACEASVAQVTFALNTDNLENLFVPQSPELFEKMLSAKALGICRLHLFDPIKAAQRVQKAGKRRVQKPSKPLRAELEVQRLEA